MNTTIKVIGYTVLAAGLIALGLNLGVIMALGISSSWTNLIISMVLILHICVLFLNLKDFKYFLHYHHFLYRPVVDFNVDELR